MFSNISVLTLFCISAESSVGNKGFVDTVPYAGYYQCMRNTFIFMPILLILSACNINSDLLKAERHFSLEIGRMEDQIDLLRLSTEPVNWENHIYMNNGLFYVLDGKAKKLMIFNSFGYLTGMIYNETENPKPISMGSDSANEQNRFAERFRFLKPGSITVDSRGFIYVEDLLPENRWRRDDESGDLFNSVVLRFSPEGKYIDFLGFDGLGGRPFPNVTKIMTRDNGDIVVISQSNQRWNINWFSQSGQLIWPIELSYASFPSIEGAWSKPEGLSIDPVEDRFFIHTLYYSEDTGEFLKSIVNWFDASSGELLGSADLPEVTFQIQQASTSLVREEKKVYQLEAVAEDGLIYFLSPGANYELLILNLDRQVVARTSLDLDADQPSNVLFQINPQGIISNLVSEEFQAHVQWWRTDKLKVVNETP
jgi:hypothetical protein